MAGGFKIEVSEERSRRQKGIVFVMNADDSLNTETTIHICPYRFDSFSVFEEKTVGISGFTSKGCRHRRKESDAFYSNGIAENEQGLRIEKHEHNPYQERQKGKLEKVFRPVFQMISDVFADPVLIAFYFRYCRNLFIRP